MRRLWNRLFGREKELLFSLVALKGFPGRPRRRGRAEPSELPSVLRRRTRRRIRREEPRSARPLVPRLPAEPGEIRRAIALLVRNRAKILSTSTSLLAHAGLLLILLQIPIGSREPEEELGTIQLTLQRPPKPGAPLAERAPAKPKEEPPPPAPAAPTPPKPSPIPPELRAPQPQAPVAEPAKVEPPPVEPPDEEPGSPGTGEVARLEPEGSPGPPAVLGVGSSPPPGDGHGLGGDGEGKGFGSRSRGRAEALRRYGGSGETEDAVSKGLSWLAQHQESDGSWSASGFGRHCHHFTQCLGKGLEEFSTGVTGLAALAFLGAGQAPGSPGPYGRTVERALLSLIADQRADGALGAHGEKYLYNHAIATFALCEAYSLTHDSRFLKPALAALGFSASSQEPGGGWDYTEAQTGRNDLSITGWQVMAFRAAEVAGMGVSEDTLGRLRRFLESATTPTGEGIYANRGMGSGRRGINMTSVALLSKLYLGTSVENPWVAVAADRLIRTPPDSRLVPDWDANFQSSYYWYSATLCLFHLGGKRWEAWNHFLKREILPLQSRAPHEEGSWPPDPNWLGAMGGRIFTTALNVLTLEVYYRYPPLHTYGSGRDGAR